MTTQPGPTQAWLAAAHARGLPPLTGPAHIAEKLLLLLHFGIDWENGWAQSYRAKYWDAILPDRTLTAAYRTNTLAQWWTATATELDAVPRNAPQRIELTQLLATPHDIATHTLHCLRTETTALVLRTRITSEAVRDARAKATA